MNKLTTIYNGNSVDCTILENSVMVSGTKVLFSKDKKKVTVDGTDYAITYYKELEDGLVRVKIDGYDFDIAVEAESFEDIKGDAERQNIVKSPISGVVTSIRAELGQEVKKGELALIISAMKMENEIIFPISGKITRMELKVDQRIKNGETLLEIGII